MRKYNEVMARVEVTEEMKSRILKNLRSADAAPAKVVRFPNAKRYIALAACFAVVLIGVLAVTLNGRSPRVEDPTGGLITAGAPVEYKSAKALSRASGIKIRDLENLPFEATQTRYTDYGCDLAEIAYTGETQSLYYRASLSSADPSGDLNEYENVSTEEIGGLTVTLKGAVDLVYLAIYEKDGCFYSIGSTAGLTLPQLEAMLG